MLHDRKKRREKLLSNENYVSKAPSSIVEKEREVSTNSNISFILFPMKIVFTKSFLISFEGEIIML